MATSSWLASLFSGSLLIKRAEARFPWNPFLTPSMPPADSSVTFDPLGVAAILDNPRAFASASRLYTQRDIDIYRWPPMNMIGGTLPPVSCLMEHLSSRMTSNHPALSMALSTQETLTVGSDTNYKELPVNFSNIWIRDLMSFRSSECPDHDIQIIHLESLYGNLREGIRTWPLCVIINFVGTSSALLTAAGLVLSIFAGDAWSIALFASYLYHWLASKLVSIKPLVTCYRAKKPIMPDDTIRHAVYKRPEGGFIVFKARQDIFDRWARSTWMFNRTWRNTAVHWNWMISGFLGAFASVVCMVNMAGYTQLAFLGILTWTSGAEIIVTHCARHVITKARFFGDTFTVSGSDTWTMAVIRASLEVDDPFRLNGLDFVRLGFLPDFSVFRNMCALLQHPWDEETDPAQFDNFIDEKMMDDVLPKKAPWARSIAEEIKEVLRTRHDRAAGFSSDEKMGRETSTLSA